MGIKLNIFDWLVWVMLNIISLAPVVFGVIGFRMINLPFIIYSLGVWFFLVVGVPVFAYREHIAHSFGTGIRFAEYNMEISGYFAFGIFLAIVPAYISMIINSGLTKNGSISPSNHPKVSPTSMLLFYVFWLVSICGVGAYVLNFGYPPLFRGFEFSNSAAVYSVRMTTTYSSSFSVYADYFNYFPLLAAVIGHGLYRANRITLVTDALSIVFALVLSFSFLHKSHMLFLVLGVILVDIYVGGRAIKKFAIACAAVLGLLIVTYYYYVGSGIEIINVLVMIANRLIGTYFVSLSYVIAEFPSTHDFFYGRALPNPKGIFGDDSVYLSGFIMSELGGKDSGTIPVPAIGSMYANFGWFGAVLSSAFISLWLFFLSLFYKMAKADIALISIWLIMVIKVVKISNQDFFAAVEILPAFVLFVSFALASYLRNKEFKWGACSHL